MVKKQIIGEMMVKLNAIVKFLDKELKIRKIKDECKNGLEIRASEKINKVGLATDACLDVFIKAKKLRCNLIIVHHGLFWKDKKDLYNFTTKRVSFLKKNKISLYAAHLPLDINKKYGNNSNILRLIDVEPKAIFGGVGYLGYLKKPRDVNSIVKVLENKLETRCKVLRFGKSKVKKIAIMTGYGSPDVPEAIKKNVDLFITGEATHGAFHRAKEGKINLIFAGHYKTETLGLKLLGNLLEETFKLKTVFIDSPTGL